MRLISWLNSVRQRIQSCAVRSESRSSRRIPRPIVTSSEVLEMRVLLTSDFGDAPLPFPVTAAENGAQHSATGPILGTNRDSEADGVHSATANADDTTLTPDDEDGA